MRVVAFYHSGPVHPYVLKMVQSVKANIPLPLIFLTDTWTVDISGVDQTVRKDYGEAGQHTYAKVMHAAALDVTELLLLDTDVIVHKDVQHVFDEPFDVAMYPRGSRSGDSRYNGGVVFTKNRDFWRAVVEVINKIPQHHGSITVDQIAENRVIESGEFNVYDLHQSYNWTPDPRKGTYPDKHIVHYKGGRKKWM